MPSLATFTSALLDMPFMTSSAAPIYPSTSSKPMNENAEQLNGRMAMLGIIAALGAYAVSGQIIPGIW